MWTKKESREGGREGGKEGRREGGKERRHWRGVSWRGSRTASLMRDRIPSSTPSIWKPHQSHRYAWGKNEKAYLW